MKNDNFTYEIETDPKSGEKSITITGLAEDKKSTMSTVRIPSDIDGIPVTKIGDSAFFGNSKIAFVYMPDSIVEIGERAFERCSKLTSITFSKNLKKMGDYCLCDCKSLDSVELSDTVEHIGVAALARTGIKSFSIPPLVKKLNDALFEECESLVSLKAKGRIKSVGEMVCYGCKLLESFPFQKTIEKYGRYAFAESGIREAEIGRKTKHVGDHLFHKCHNLVSLKLNIDQSQFDEPILGYKIVEGCENLKDVKVPESMKRFLKATNTGRTELFDGIIDYVNKSNTESDGIDIQFRKNTNETYVVSISNNGNGNNGADLTKCVLTSNKSDNKKHKMHP